MCLETVSVSMTKSLRFSCLLLFYLFLLLACVIRSRDVHLQELIDLRQTSEIYTSTVHMCAIHLLMGLKSWVKVGRRGSTVVSDTWCYSKCLSTVFGHNSKGFNSRGEKFRVKGLKH